jgi:hypothetical protein
MSTTSSESSNNMNPTPCTTPPEANIMDNNNSNLDDDEDTIAVIRAPNESPDRRRAPTIPTIEMATTCQYVDEFDTEDYHRSVVLTHKKYDNCYGALFAMVIGVPEYDKMLDNPPFSETKKKVYTKDFRPSNLMLMEEVQRRVHFLSKLNYDPEEDNPFLKNKKIILPKPTQWGHDKLMKWLKEHLLMWNMKDFAYMKHNIGIYKKKLEIVLLKKGSQFNLDETAWARTGWDGILPNVRLISIITSDELKEAFINRNDSENRLELDARGTESAKVSFFDTVRIKFNDPLYLVTSMRLEATWGGQIFLDSHSCNWTDLEVLNVSKISDAAACKRHYLKLNNSLGNVHQRWIASGNGDEQLEDDVNDNNRQVQGGDKLDFLHTENISTMYLWYSLLKAGLFDHAKTNLPDEFKADGKAPDIIGTASSSIRRSQRSVANSVQESIQPFTNDFGEMKQMMIKENQYQRNENEEQKHRSHLYAVMNLLRNNKNDLKSEIKSMQETLAKNKESLFVTEDKLFNMNNEKNNYTEQHIKLYETRVLELNEEVTVMKKDIENKNKALDGIIERLANKEQVVMQLEKELRLKKNDVAASIYTTGTDEDRVVERASEALTDMGNVRNGIEYSPSPLNSPSTIQSLTTPQIVRQLTRKRIRSPRETTSPTRRSSRLNSPGK